MPFWIAAILILATIAVLVGRRGAKRIDARVKDPLGESFELFNLEHRAADHKSADAIVRVPTAFNPAQPIHLIVYNHGFYTDVAGAYHDAHLAEQMRHAPPNSVLFLPEWQKRPTAASGDQGHFSEGGMFAGMVNEAFQKVPALSGKTLADVRSIALLGHSAGYGPTETEIYKNGIGDKIVSVTLLDALYDHDGFNDWLKANAKALGSGSKRFYNIFFGTAKYSKDQAAFLKKTLSDAGLASTLVVEDYDSGDQLLDAAAFAEHSIIFKFSSAKVEGLEPHFAIPNLYVAKVVAADRRKV